MSGGFRNPEETGTDLTAAEILFIQTGTAGVILLKEQTSTPATTAGYGKIYTKTNGNLYYLNDAGTEVQIATGSGSGTAVYNERFVGPASTFTLVHSPQSAAVVRAYRGGGRQDQGGAQPDYSMSGNLGTLSTALSAGEVLLIDYIY